MPRNCHHPACIQPATWNIEATVGVQSVSPELSREDTRASCVLGCVITLRRLRDGWTVTFHQPRMLGNGLDHGVGLGVGCDGRTSWSVVGSLDERRGRATAANRALIKYTIY